MKWRVLALLMASSLPGCGPEAADLIFTGGRVYTFAWPDPGPDGTPSPAAPRAASGDWHPDAEAVAVRDGLVVFVGSAAETEAYRGPGTEVIDLQGATLLPGLVDSHTHITELGASLEHVDLVGVETEEEAVRLAAERAADLPPGSWVLGAGWDEGAWADRYPTWDLLSRAVPDHPVYLRGLHGFAGWGNRLAFEMAGIGPDTEVPVGGEAVRNDRGELTGLLLNRAVPLMDDAIPEPSSDHLETRISEGLREMARSGYVAVHYAGVTAPSLAALERLRTRDELPIRVYAMLNARDTVLLRTWLDRGPQVDAAGWLTVRSVKAYYDGALGSRGARMIEDYSDRPGHRGVSGEGYGFDRDWVARMMRAGFQVGVHAIGDAGNRETLEFLESVAEDHPGTSDARHRIEHAQIVHPDDFQRFRALGLVASMEPPHAVEDKTWAEDRVGPDRILGGYAWRTMRTTGVPVTFNSDLPGSDWSPFYGLHAAVTRTDKALEPAGGWYPDQALTMEEAIRAYSTWAAWAAFSEEQTGSIAPGRWADFTVLDVDPLTLDAPSDLLSGSVTMTVVAGQMIVAR